METPHANVFVIDPQSIYRRGLMSCLGEMPFVAAIDGVDTPHQAWEHPALADADLVLIDVGACDAIAAIERLSRCERRMVLATATAWQQAELLGAVGSGALGVMCKKGLTQEALGAQVHAIITGAGVMPPNMLSTLVAGQGKEAGIAPAPLTRITGLTSREQIVLKLIADGRLLREVADELSYSERTVKMVLSTAVGKLGARSRSQAVAHAVREGII
ncbi:MAG: response regulator transcription factor [Solirubrobacteraceae bacterium]